MYAVNGTANGINNMPQRDAATLTRKRDISRNSDFNLIMTNSIPIVSSILPSTPNRKMLRNIIRSA